MLDNIIQWLNTYPSRKLTLIGYGLLFIYVFIILKIRLRIQEDKELNKQRIQEARELEKQRKRCKRFVYCVGKKSNIAYVDLVTEFEYDNLLERDENGYYHEISYAIIDRNTSSTYFLLP